MFVALLSGDPDALLCKRERPRADPGQRLRTLPASVLQLQHGQAMAGVLAMPTWLASKGGCQRPVHLMSPLPAVLWLGGERGVLAHGGGLCSARLRSGPLMPGQAMPAENKGYF